MVERVTKPIEQEVLVATILKWAQPGGEPVPPPLVHAAVPPTLTFSAEPGQIDWQILQHNFRDKPAAIVRIVRITLDSIAEVPAKLRQLAMANDFQGLAFESHKLRGIAADLGALATQELATQMGNLANQGDAASLPLAGALADSLLALRAELERFLEQQSVQASAQPA